MEDLKNIVKVINNSDNWLECQQECKKICELAGLSEKWKNAILKEASNLLNIDIGL